MPILYSLARDADALLRGRAPADKAGLHRCLALGVLAAMFYGAVMGTFGLTPERWPQVFYSSVKVPLLSVISLFIALPAAYLFFALTGLGEDFSAALRALLLAQSAQGMVLASLCPFTLLLYYSTIHYPTAVLANVIIFSVAGVAGLYRLKVAFAPLVKRDARNKQLLRGWLFLTAFIGIQSSWMMRPFVGNPNLHPVFVRTEGWSNAYEQIWHLMVGNF